jgi:mono/diheme cytochrome c family protein
MVLALAALSTACGGGEESSESDNGVGSVSNGEKLYEQTTIGSASAPGCITCHSVTDPDWVGAGPPHVGIATTATTRVEGMSAEEYLRDSIMNPDNHITEGYAAGVMYQSYATDLPAPQINDLVAYLLTLE